MRDFSEFKGNGENGNDNVFGFMKNVAKKFDGKSTDELYRAVIEEAKKRKKAGTLTDAEIDAFVNTLSPFLDGEKKRALNRIAEKIKNS